MQGFALGRKETTQTGVAASRFGGTERILGMLLIIAIVLILLWTGGFAFHVAGGLIHLLLVIALILFILHLVRGRGV
jgi:flagellar biogenesis protein FliO